MSKTPFVGFTKNNSWFVDNHALPQIALLAQSLDLHIVGAIHELHLQRIRNLAVYQDYP